MLDTPSEDTLAGLRDRAILSVGLQVGLRRAEIAALTVGDLHQNRGYDSLRVMRKGGRRDALAINPQTAARLRAYLEAPEHGADTDGPLFRPLATMANAAKSAGAWPADPPDEHPSRGRLLFNLRQEATGYPLSSLPVRARF
jgi:integrase/recombinase XerD